MGSIVTFTGRLPRHLFWAQSFVSGPLVFAGMYVFNESTITPTFFRTVLGLALWALGCIIGLCSQVRRWHDIGMSGWAVLINCIPYAGVLLSLVILGFVPGNKEANDYGEHPAR